jgi:hypothetical protein
LHFAPSGAQLGFYANPRTPEWLHWTRDSLALIQLAADRFQARTQLKTANLVGSPRRPWRVALTRQLNDSGHIRIGHFTAAFGGRAEVSQPSSNRRKWMTKGSSKHWEHSRICEVPLTLALLPRGGLAEATTAAQISPKLNSKSVAL